MDKVITESEFDGGFTLPDKVALVFYLVIRNHKPEWCKDIEKTLMAAFPLYLKKIWKPEVYVINQESAIKRDLVIR